MFSQSWDSIVNESPFSREESRRQPCRLQLKSTREDRGKIRKSVIIGVLPVPKKVTASLAVDNEINMDAAAAAVFFRTGH